MTTATSTTNATPHYSGDPPTRAGASAGPVTSMSPSTRRTPATIEIVASDNHCFVIHKASSSTSSSDSTGPVMCSSFESLMRYRRVREDKNGRTHWKSNTGDRHCWAMSSLTTAPLLGILTVTISETRSRPSSTPRRSVHSFVRELEVGWRSDGGIHLNRPIANT